MMAADLGIAEETVSRWVHGHSAPSSRNLLAMLSYLQDRDPSVSLEDIFSGE